VKLVAASKNVDLPQSLSQDFQHRVAHLENQPADTFNEAYVNLQSDGHHMASAEFKYEIESGRDDDERALAVKTLPQIFLHQRLLANKQTMISTAQPAD
jgi:putative membrane protein